MNDCASCHWPELARAGFHDAAEPMGVLLGRVASALCALLASMWADISAVSVTAWTSLVASFRPETAAWAAFKRRSTSYGAAAVFGAVPVGASLGAPALATLAAFCLLLWTLACGVKRINPKPRVVQVKTLQHPPPTPNTLARAVAANAHAIKAIELQRVGGLPDVALESALHNTLGGITHNLTVRQATALTAVPDLRGCGVMSGTAPNQQDNVLAAAIALLLMMLRRIAVTPGLYEELWASLGPYVLGAADQEWSTLNNNIYTNSRVGPVRQLVCKALGLPADQVLPGRCNQKNAQVAALTMLGLLMHADVLRRV